MLAPWPTRKQLRKMNVIPHEQLEAVAKGYGRPATHNLEVPTLNGDFALGATAYGVAMVFFPDTDEFDVSDTMEKYGLALGSAGTQRSIEAGLELMGYMVGEVKQFSSPVDLSFHTPFCRDVYTALRSIPFGEIITYGELATLAGHPGKARAVGVAMRYNPAPIFIPCHRVVGANGVLGGWSGPDGWKEWLHELEGIELAGKSIRTQRSTTEEKPTT